MSTLRHFTLPTHAVAALAASIVVMTAADNAFARGGRNHDDGNRGGGDRQHSRSDRKDGGSDRRDSRNAQRSAGKMITSSRDRGRSQDRTKHSDSRRDRKEKAAEREGRHKEKIAQREAKRAEKEAAKKDTGKKDQETANKTPAPVNPAPVIEKNPAPVVTSPVNTTPPTPTPIPASGPGSPVVTPPKNTIHPIPGTPAPVVRDHRHEAGAAPAGEGGATVSSKSGTVQVDEKSSITTKDVAAVAAKTEIKNLSGLGAGIVAPFIFNGAAAYGLATGGVKKAASNVKETAKAFYEYFSW